MTSKDDKYYDLKKLAAYSSLSVRTLRDYISDAINPLPSYCLKRKILIKKSEFDCWMEQFRGRGKDLDRIVDEITNDL